MNGFDALRQAYTCLYLLIGGAGAGLIYDALAPMRRGSRALRAASDTLFACAATAICFAALVMGGAESARLYAACAFFLGLLLWRFGPRRWIRGFFHILSRKRRIRVEKHME